MFKALVLVMSLASASCVAHGVTQNLPQRPVAMNDLTVPKKLLPTGCGLSTMPYLVEGNGVLGGGLWASLGITTNPWTGTDRKTIATLRQAMGDAPLLTDSPFTTREALRYFISLADGVEEGYAAIYMMQSDPNLIVVYALRFAANERRFYPPGTRSNHRFEIGPLDAVVAGGGGQCSEAVEDHLKSLALVRKIDPKTRATSSP